MQIQAQFNDSFIPYQESFFTKKGEELIRVTSIEQDIDLETAYFIYLQILDIERLICFSTAHEVEKRGGKIISVYVDAVKFEHPSQIDFSDAFYWKSETPMFKYEQVSLVMFPVVCKMSTFEMPDHTWDHIKDDMTFQWNTNACVEYVASGEKGCILLGMPGTGKTCTANSVIKRLKEEQNIEIINESNEEPNLTEGAEKSIDKFIIKNKEYQKQVICLAPTNMAAKNIQGLTLDKFYYQFFANTNKKRKLRNKLRNVHSIFVDEISMVREIHWRMLLSIKMQHPNIRFFLIGDFNQLPPVCDKADFIYENAHILHYLTDGRKCTLELGRRSDLSTFNICKSIIDGSQSCLRDHLNKNWSFNIKECKTHITFTNQRRIEINDLCCKKFITNAKCKAYPISISKFAKNKQPYKLCKGMPLIAKKKIVSLGVFNNQFFTCQSINEKDQTVTLAYRDNHLKDIVVKLDDKFGNVFQPAFAITTHCSQGQTIKDKFCIHEMDRMMEVDKRLAFVAISRTHDLNEVSFILDEKELETYHSKQHLYPIKF